MMVYCLNPACQKPLNPDVSNFCQNCGTKLVPLLKGRYRVVKPLGGGGFGRTFLAEDEHNLKEPCVVKQLAPEVQGTQAIEKATHLFKEEAKRLEQLGAHPQIPTLYDHFEQDKYLYLVQQFISGQNLRQELEQGVFSEQKIWQLLIELLPVLQFVHEHRVIHRDVKPENIIRCHTSPLQKEVGLVLIDFGIAKQLTATAVAKPGTIIGSFGYAPIEQMKGGKAYPSSDIYGLGVTCFHLLTQIDPWDLWTEQGYGWVSNWRQHLKFSISLELEQVLDKMLQKDSLLRYQSATEVLRHLNAGRSEQHQRQQPKVKTQNKKLFFWHFKFLLLLFQKKPWLMLGVILLLGLGGYGSWQMQEQLLAINSPWQKLELVKTLFGHSDLVGAVAITPDGQTLVSASNDNTIKIWQLSTGTLENTILGHSSWVGSVTLSQDGQILASGSGDKTIKIWQLNTGQLLRTLEGHSDWVDCIAISPDGQTLVSGSGDNTIKIWQLSNGKLLRTLTGHSYSVTSLVISPNDQTLVSGNGSVWPLGDEDYTIKIWNLKTGVPSRTLTGHLSNVNAVAFTPDEQTLVSGSSDRTIKIWQMSTNTMQRTLSGHTGPVLSVAISPDGQTLVSGSSDNTIKIWQLGTGQLLRTLTGHSGSVLSVAISPDGHTLVSGSSDKTIKIWHLP